MYLGITSSFSDMLSLYSSFWIEVLKLCYASDLLILAQLFVKVQIFDSFIESQPMSLHF